MSGACVPSNTNSTFSTDSPNSFFTLHSLDLNLQADSRRQKSDWRQLARSWARGCTSAGQAWPVGRTHRREAAAYARGGGVVLGGEVGRGLGVGDGWLGAVEHLRQRQGWLGGGEAGGRAARCASCAARRLVQTATIRRRKFRAESRQLGPAGLLACWHLAARLTLLPSSTHWASSKTHSPMENSTSMAWPAKVAGFFSPAG
jgi:hypothetical protein